MSDVDNYYALNQVIIAENHCPDYRWVITDYCMNTGFPGVTIEYQEKEDGEFKVISSIEMGVEPAKLLIESLNKINVDN